MEHDFGIEVLEVNFDQFERRKASRKISNSNELQNNSYFFDGSYEVDKMQIEVYSVTEVTFDHFERRKDPR
jgi:hypothetical protein